MKEAYKQKEKEFLFLFPILKEKRDRKFKKSLSVVLCQYLSSFFVCLRTIMDCWTWFLVERESERGNRGFTALTARTPEAIQERQLDRRHQGLR